MKHSELVKKLNKNASFRKNTQKYLESIEYQINTFMFKARIHAGLSQEKLAKKIGTKQSGIARLETVSYMPNIVTLEKIAKACKGRIEIKFIPNKLAPSARE